MSVIIFYSLVGHAQAAYVSQTKITGAPADEEIIKHAAELAIKAPYKIREAGEYTKYAIAKCAVGIFKGIHLKEEMTIPAGLILNESNCALLDCEPICLSSLVTIKDGAFAQSDLSALSESEIANLKSSAQIVQQHTLVK